MNWVERCIAQSPKLGSSDWRYYEVGRIGDRSGPAAETFLWRTRGKGSELGGVPDYHHSQC